MLVIFVFNVASDSKIPDNAAFVRLNLALDDLKDLTDFNPEIIL